MYSLWNLQNILNEIKQTSQYFQRETKISWYCLLWSQHRSSENKTGKRNFLSLLENNNEGEIQSIDMTSRTFDWLEFYFRIFPFPLLHILYVHTYMGEYAFVYFSSIHYIYIHYLDYPCLKWEKWAQIASQSFIKNDVYETINKYKRINKYKMT